MENKPFENKKVLQILVILVVLLAIAAGYFYTAYGYEVKKNNRLENKLMQLQQGNLK